MPAEGDAGSKVVPVKSIYYWAKGRDMHLRRNNALSKDEVAGRFGDRADRYEYAEPYEVNLHG
jgi:hypothetical protein